MNLQHASLRIVPAALALCLCLPGCGVFARKAVGTSPPVVQNATATDNVQPMPNPAPTPGKVNPVGPLPAAKQTLDLLELKELGLAYLNVAFTGKPPKNVDDLDLKQTPKYYKAVADKGVILYWNVDPTRLPAGSSNTILGYVHDVPTKGGAVLMADGSARRMTVDEFNKTAKAGQ
jgi:hypothetical protein